MLIKVQPDSHPNPLQGKDAAEAAKAITVPDQKPGESVEEYSDRLKWHRQKEQAEKPLLFEKPIQGFIGTSGGMVPRDQSAYKPGNHSLTDAPVDASTVGAEARHAPTTYEFDALPPIVRRSAEDRFSDVSTHLRSEEHT